MLFRSDCIVSNSDTVSDYLKNNKLHSVFLTKEADVSFAVQQGEPVLLSILNKTLTSMPTTQFSGAVVSYNASSRKVTAKDFIQDNLLTVSLIAGISFFVVLVDTFGTSKLREDQLVEMIRKHFDLRPAGIIKMLDLRRPIYKQTAAYGHFGRDDLDLPWEKLDKVDELKAYL